MSPSRTRHSCDCLLMRTETAKDEAITPPTPISLKSEDTPTFLPPTPSPPLLPHAASTTRPPSPPASGGRSPSGAHRADGLKIASWRELKRLVLVGLPRGLMSENFRTPKGFFTVSGRLPDREPISPGSPPGKLFRRPSEVLLRYFYSSLLSSGRLLRSSSHPHSLVTRR